MIKVFWANREETVILLEYIAPITSWEEYRAAVKLSYEMVRSKSHPVHLVHHTGNVPMPRGNAIMHVRHAVQQVPPNTGKLVMVIQNLMARRILELMMKWTLHENAVFAGSLDEAYRITGISMGYSGHGDSVISMPTFG